MTATPPVTSSVMPPTTPLRWLTRPRRQGVTWGVPWPRGTAAPDTAYRLVTGEREVPVQSWVTGRWPDGSVRWSAHAIAAEATDSPDVRLEPSDGPGPAVPGPKLVTATADDVVVDTGTVRWRLPRSGSVLVAGAERDGRDVLGEVRLISRWQESADDDHLGASTGRVGCTGRVESVVVEQDGPIRAVVRIDGHHVADPQDSAVDPRLPFRVRLVFTAGTDDVRIVHTLIWDRPFAAPATSLPFLAGLGLQTSVPLVDEPHDRHVRLAGPVGADPDDAYRPGFLTEAVRGLTGLRRDPGADVRAAQVAGRACPRVATWAPAVADRRHLIPTWSDWTLDQTSADGFTLRKRTSPGHGWVTVPAATRSAGFGYVGGVAGGLGFGLRDFWQSHPTRLDIRGAAGSVATATVWLWSPSAPVMDLRFYHDGLGQDSYAEQLEGLEITYEDYEPGFGDADGIARTHELTLHAYGSTPDHDTLAADAAALQDPALLVATPDRLHLAGIFGDWGLPDRSTPAKALIEDRLDLLVDYYLGQREDRRWYGCWDYGDVMHTYDPDRHQWRYDVGGYAWDNSELSPDLFFWYQFLRTGRADVFRLAEALARHGGEVDVYHRGRWAGLGTRHNVQHWGCSAKQLRISNAAYRRFLHHLTADERTGDLLDEVAEAERTLLGIDPTRKVRTDVYRPDPGALAVGLGTDYGGLLGAWLSAWERHGDEGARDKLLGTMADIGALPRGFLTGEALLDLSTCRFDTTRDRIAVSHLSAVFGLVELCTELIGLTSGTEFAVPGFERAWLQYCRLYLAPADTQRAEVGQELSGISLIQAHSRLLAWAAARTGDAGLAADAWRAFDAGAGDQLNRNPLHADNAWQVVVVDGPAVLHPVREAAAISTNDTAQYGLAAIQNLALIGGLLPDGVD